MSAPSDLAVLTLTRGPLLPGESLTVEPTVAERRVLGGLPNGEDRCLVLAFPTNAVAGLDELPERGTLARWRAGALPGTLEVEGLESVRVLGVQAEKGGLWARVEPLEADEETDGPHQAEARRLAARLERAPLSAAAREVAARELEHLRHAAAQSNEVARIRNYLEWMSELPWPTDAPTPPIVPAEFEAVRASLDAMHVGLADVKERVAEFLAVRLLGGGARGTVLCFVGPPGTGKSSMGRAVARALDRRFLTIPVGAMTQEREIVGVSHRQESGMPGAILTGLARCRSADPVVLLDEVDKIALGGEGTSAGAFLQLLDPEQNCEFFDHYLGVPFDLSRALFLATANDADEIPEALLDRMEVIEFNGYTESEKFTIARQHLLPRARAHAGVDRAQFRISPAATRELIRGYTEEAGVRDLQRRLMALARKAAVRAVRGDAELSVKKADLGDLLGPRTVGEEPRLRAPAVGVATGLAWTSVGGALLPIETVRMPGTGRMVLTGQVGDVLRESVQTAVSWLRSTFEEFGLASDLLEHLDLHLHFPSAATPKDGPSAGIAIACALVSLLSGRPARHDVAMTGEVSLLGDVLPVGGLREKLLAAIRSGVREVVLPARNAEEIMRLSPEIRGPLVIHLVDDVRDAIALALVRASRPGRSKGSDRAPRPRPAQARRRRRRR